MAESIMGDALHIFWGNELASGEPGNCTGATIQCNGAAWAGAELDPFLELALWVSCGHHKLHDVLLYLLCHVQIQHGLSGGKDVCLGELGRWCRR